jgi:transmembrane 9 superfamily protein 3
MMKSQVYYVYGFFLLVFLILLAVTVCVAVVGTYFLLNAENHRWQWASFGAGASTALYVFAYSLHYLVAKTKMSGLLQISFFVGYNLVFCLGLGIMCGALGHLAAAAFVRRIFRGVKVD